MNPLSYQYKSLISRLMLVAVLVVSFFTFAGQGVDIRHKAAAQQAWLLQKPHRATGKIIAYTRASVISQSSLIKSQSFVLPAISLDVAYNQFVSHQLKGSAQQNIPGLSFGFHYIVHQNNGDEPAASVA